MMERDPERLARPSKKRVGMTERERWHRERRAPWRRRLVGRAGYAERPLRDRVVGLEVIVRNRPVVGDSIERSETEILGVQPEGIALPVQRAPTHPARAFVAELVGNVSADRVAIQLAWRRLPRI